jgi:hypothetical protein
MLKVAWELIKNWYLLCRGKGKKLSTMGVWKKIVSCIIFGCKTIDFCGRDGK